jgi:hypothetical protein
MQRMTFCGLVECHCARQGVTNEPKSGYHVRRQTKTDGQRQRHEKQKEVTEKSSGYLQAILSVSNRKDRSLRYNGAKNVNAGSIAPVLHIEIH